MSHKLLREQEHMSDSSSGLAGTIIIHKYILLFIVIRLEVRLFIYGCSYITSYVFGVSDTPWWLCHPVVNLGHPLMVQNG